MTWEMFIPIATTYGLKVAEYLWQLVNKGQPPTQAEWDILNKKKVEFAHERTVLSLIANGIDPESERGKSILALVDRP